MSGILETALGQLLALITFFAFPALQYFSLKQMTQHEGRPELWYLPQFGFRLVIRNLPRQKTFSEIKYRAILRSIIRATPGASVATYQDILVHQKEDFFLFPGNDQVLVCFRLEIDREGNLFFVLTDKLGNERSRTPINEFDRLVCDYTANVENLLNFDIKLAKRIEIEAKSMNSYWQAIQADPVERSFPVSRIRTVG